MVFGYVLYVSFRLSSYNGFLIVSNTVEKSYIRAKMLVSNILRSSANVSRSWSILVVIGTRPEAIKCAPLITELTSEKYSSTFRVKIVNTGQHHEILKQSLDDLKVNIDVNLNLMSHNQSLPILFAEIFTGITTQIHAYEPDLLIVQGDTTTALAAALAGAYQKVPIAHVEAGLRSFDFQNPYPEELNRKVIDSFATLLFAPTTFARRALLQEGICDQYIFVTGNTGIDAFYQMKKKMYQLPKNPMLESIYSFKSKHIGEINAAIILITIHRRENIQHLPEMCQAIKTIANTYGEKLMIILPVHPNPNVRHLILAKLRGSKNVHIVDPIPFTVFGQVMSLSDIIVTDSGGIQEEAASIGKPVVLLRLTTERPEGVYLGTIKQVGIHHDDIVESIKHMLTNLGSATANVARNFFGNGTASKQIALIINRFLNGSITIPNRCKTRMRQDAIARTVYASHNENFATIETNTISHSHAERKRNMEEMTIARPQITLHELLQKPSKYDHKNKADDVFSLTAIVSIYKREGIVERWIDALISQTHPPREIWITSFASPIAEKLRNEIDHVRSKFKWAFKDCLYTCTQDGYKKKISRGKDTNSTCLEKCKTLPTILFVNIGEMQLKYFGRFQLGLQCHTKYVVIMDDDCIPQPRYFEIAMHTINTEQYRGILGTKGTPAEEKSFFGPLSRSDRIIEVDVVGGSWFMEQEWVKLMFHSKLYSWETGEDWHLCSNARKYANIRSFVMPVQLNDTSTNSFSYDYLNMSYTGDTTGVVAGTTKSRKYIIRQLWLRGDRLMNSYTQSQSSLLIFSENDDDATILVKYSKPKLASLGVRISFATTNAAKTNLNISRIQSDCNSFHDFMIGRDYDMDPTPIILASETMYAFDMTIQGTQSTAVLIMGSSSSIATVAIATASLLRNIPIISIYMEDGVLDEQRAEAIANMSTFVIRTTSGRFFDYLDMPFMTKYLEILYG